MSSLHYLSTKNDACYLMMEWDINDLVRKYYTLIVYMRVFCSKNFIKVRFIGQKVLMKKRYNY